MHNVMMAAEYFVDIYNSILELDTGPTIPQSSEFGQIFISELNEEMLAGLSIVQPDRVSEYSLQLYHLSNNLSSPSLSWFITRCKWYCLKWESDQQSLPWLFSCLQYKILFNNKT